VTSDWQNPDWAPGEDEDAAEFWPTVGGAEAIFPRVQAVIIRTLVSQLAERISEEPEGDAADMDDLEAELGLSGSAEKPDDPVLARLLPDAYSEDPEASAEFRRYTEQSLRSGKVAAAQGLLATLPAGGGKVTLNEEQCQDWLRALNDLRLALGVILDITEESDQQSQRLSADDPRSVYMVVYHQLSYLQQSLVLALE
jgi:Domain of unknown function (DUF2017)